MFVWAQSNKQYEPILVQQHAPKLGVVIVLVCPYRMAACWSTRSRCVAASCVNSKWHIKESSAAGSHITFLFIVPRLIFDYVSPRGDRFDGLCCETLLCRCSRRKYIYVNSTDKTWRDMVSTPSLTQGGFFYPAFMLSSDLATLHPLPEQHMQMFSSSLF